MKGLIAEIDGRSMVVITENGDFVKLKRDIKYGIGDEIQMPVRSRSQMFRALSTVAASMLICAMLGSGVYAYYTPYSYVSVDINPSLGLSLNRFDKVIDIQPLNEDAEKLISEAKPVKHENVDEALSDILQSAAEKGYLKPDQENGVMVVVSAKGKKEETKLMNELKAVSQKELAKVSNNYNVMLDKTSIKDYKAAVEQKTSPGKAKLAERITRLDPSVPAADINNMTVNQAMDMLKERRSAHKEVKRSAKEGYGHRPDNKQDKNTDSRENGRNNSGNGVVKSAEKDDKPKDNSPAKGKGDRPAKAAGVRDAGKEQGKSGSITNGKSNEGSHDQKSGYKSKAGSSQKDNKGSSNKKDGKSSQHGRKGKGGSSSDKGKNNK